MAILVVANMLPLIGVVYWNWNALEVVIIYWLENLVIGVINILKMLAACPRPNREQDCRSRKPSWNWQKRDARIVVRGSLRER